MLYIFLCQTINDDSSTIMNRSKHVCSTICLSTCLLRVVFKSKYNWSCRCTKEDHKISCVKKKKKQRVEIFFDFFFFHIKQRKRWTWNLLVILSCSCVAFFASTYIPCSTCIHVLHLISPSTPFLFSHYIYPIKIFHSQFLKYLW